MTLGYCSGRRHELKTWPEYFEAVIDGRKTAEIRHNDRGFRVGDVLWLREWEPGSNGRYTGREASAVITHVVDGLPGMAGYAMLSMGRVTGWWAEPSKEHA